MPLSDLEVGGDGGVDHQAHVRQVDEASARGVYCVAEGVQASPGNIGALFRLLVDGDQIDFTRQEFHQSGWELRGVTLSRIAFLAAGSHTISVQWAVTSGTLTCCWYGDLRQIQVIEL
jgi:hypothetical protein